MMRKLVLWSPFVLIFGLLTMFYLGLRRPDDHVIASQMVGQMLPEFTTLAAGAGQPASASADFRDGKPRLLNIFASWCGPCQVEAPMLQVLQAQGVEIDGVAVNDTAPDLARFLAANGNPYTRLGLDQQGRAQMAFGSAGVPETFVVNGRGEIVHQHIGMITQSDIPTILAMLKAAR